MSEDGYKKKYDKNPKNQYTKTPRSGELPANMTKHWGPDFSVVVSKGWKSSKTDILRMITQTSGGGSGVCYLTDEQFMFYTDLSRRMVLRYLRELEDEGFIQRKKIVVKNPQTGKNVTRRSITVDADMLYQEVNGKNKFNYFLSHEECKKRLEEQKLLTEQEEEAKQKAEAKEKRRKEITNPSTMEEEPFPTNERTEVKYTLPDGEEFDF